MTLKNNIGNTLNPLLNVQNTLGHSPNHILKNTSKNTKEDFRGDAVVDVLDNTKTTLLLLRELQRQGIREICICPSTRNASLVVALNANPSHFKVYSFFEERSASFFALGRIKSTQKPVAIVTTSGTAVGELLPATMEAHYAGLPLILITADRPRQFRGSGAPQTAEQVGIFGVYVSLCIDLENDFNWEFPEWNRNYPIHLNVCFDEPLLGTDGNREGAYDLSPLIRSGSENSQAFKLENQQGQQIQGIQPDQPNRGTRQDQAGLPNQQGQAGRQDQNDQRQKIREFFKKSSRPLIVVGGVSAEDRPAVARLLLEWRVPTYLEGLSGLREDIRFEEFQLYTSQTPFVRAHRLGYEMDGLIRIGTVPTLRFWRDLDLQNASLPVLSLSCFPLSGLGRPSTLINGDLTQICQMLREELLFFSRHGSFESFLKEDRKLTRRLKNLFLEEPRSEPSLVSALSARIPVGSRVYLGNSMPIREWDLGAVWEDRKFEVWGSRGVNGIDGQISAFYGFAKPNIPNWGIIGDLTALYDLPGPWILAQLEEVSTTLVIVNNGGGKIFDQLFPNRKEFQNQHRVSFRAWAEMWGIAYRKWDDVPPTIKTHLRHEVIEVVPDEESTQNFWKKYKSFFE